MRAGALRRARRRSSDLRRMGGGAIIARGPRFTRGTFGRIAPDLGLQLDDVEEYVGLTAQFIGDHRGLSGNRRDDGNAYASALHGFDQRAEISVAGEENHV